MLSIFGIIFGLLYGLASVLYKDKKIKNEIARITEQNQEYIQQIEDKKRYLEYLNTPQLDFDESEEFLIYPSFRGIKIYSLTRRCVERISGKKEHERFIKVALYQGKVMRNPSGNSNSSG